MALSNEFLPIKLIIPTANRLEHTFNPNPKSYKIPQILSHRHNPIPSPPTNMFPKRRKHSPLKCQNPAPLILLNPPLKAPDKPAIQLPCVGQVVLEGLNLEGA
jgi:hypothetical protein